MKAPRKSGLVGLALLVSSFVGCPFPNFNNQSTDDGKRHWADITYVVQGKDGTPSASNITYGRIDRQNGNWVAGWNTSTGSVTLPWTSGAHNDCTGHWIRLGASTGTSPYELTLIIKDDGKVAAQKNINILGNVEYYITTLK